MKHVHVAVGVVRRGDRVLIARRPEDAHQGGLLEFPGGKVEPGETVQQALVRELAEEVGIRVAGASLEPVIGIRHDYGDKRVFLDVWQTSSFDGEPHGREGQPVQWLDQDALRDDAFPAANRPIIRALRLPRAYPVSGGEGLGGDALYQHLCARLDHLRPELFLLRAPWLEENDYRSLAARLIDWCGPRQIGVMLHGAPERLDSLPAAGVHLPWRVAAGLDARPLVSEALLGVSCHNEAELQHAAAIGADFATLGPVEATRSHPGAASLGWSAFVNLAGGATLPVYALGGLDFTAIARARDAGGQGVAGISAWW
ncbi:Nudix family hydrolase [Marinobacter sp. JSM 1782161]|uniref:Nudix family hydrolase n=1 Tax=Marinobacter sp. JSM 1782161 TaxID=2685906 RepID=UPI001403EF52|nr:Nudix family hydrolase [Marinobacter sp. JSM 1782161]